MKLYDSLIDDLSDVLHDKADYEYGYDANNAWPENSDYEMIMIKDSAFEFGASPNSSVNLLLFTTDSKYVNKDEIYVYGNELSNISSNVSYGRITIVKIKENEALDIDSEKMYRLLSDLEFIKYHIYTKGYMLRTSGQSNKEQVRVSKKELSNGMSFEKIGNTIIKKIKENTMVESVKLYFVTGENADYTELIKIADKASTIRKSLSVINKSLTTECSVCDIREICSEIEGLKEMHFGKTKKKNNCQVIL